MLQRKRMNSLPQSNNLYQEFGFTPEEEEEETPQTDYSQFGFTEEEKPAETPKPEKEKVGKYKSILYGFAEAVLGIPAMIQYGVNEWSKPFEKLAYGEEAPNLSFEEENPLLSIISKFPESKDEESRRFRAGAAGITAGAFGGIPGIIAGVVGSQAGQTVREVWGKEGKFEEFGWGEGTAIATDIITGAGAGVVGSLIKSGTRQATNAIPSIFRNAETKVGQTAVKNVVQGDRNALQTVIDDFSRATINQFETEASALSPQRYTELTNANVAGLQRQAENMHRQGSLSLITPLEVTSEQGGQVIQQAANDLFQEQVINAERAAYSSARESAKGVTGSAPRTIEEAKALRDSLISTTPSKEQNPLITFLDNLIADLETTTPASTTPASTLLGPNGQPVTPATQVPASQTPTVVAANDLVDMVQKGNQAVNYGSEFREQSHRLKPIIATLREETNQVLGKKPKAANLFDEANTLHARNAETWGTRYMRDVRFTENPENIVSKTKKPSNLRNLKQAIPNIEVQNIAERMVVDDVTKSGSRASNSRTIRELSPELSPNAQNAANEIINVKDPLTNSGGRAVVRNEILKDAAASVNTGKRPEKVLDLMETPKGYNLVRETLNGSPQGRQILQASERLFIEDIFNSIRDPSGRIDFSKASNIFKNNDVRQVAEMIGGPNIMQRFEQLERAANNFERNISLYSSKETQSLVSSAVDKIKDAGLVGTILHSLHVPWPVILSMGLGKAVSGVGKVSYNAIQRKVLSNPRAVQLIERLSTAQTAEEIAKQLPRLIKELSTEENQSSKKQPKK